MSEAADAYLAELESAELEAAGLLERAGPEDGELNASARHTISAMRGALRRRRAEIEGMREALRAEVRAELVAERKAESGFRRVGLPEPPPDASPAKVAAVRSTRALFDGVDPADRAAMAARVDELRSIGVVWPGQPGPPAPAPADPNLAAITAMQAAAAGGATMGSAGDLTTRMADMAAHPERYTDAQRDAVVDEYNAAVDSAARPGYGVNSS